MRLDRFFGVGLALLAFWLAGPVPAQDDEDPQARIKRCVERGVEHLKAQAKEGTWGTDELQAPGMAALVGWTLLETGVKASDASVQKATTFVRERVPGLTYTYSISLCVLFLDRLGEARDKPLIESLAARLYGGMTKQAGWFYNCPPLTPQEQEWFKTRVQKAIDNPPDKDEVKSKRPDPELVRLMDQLRSRNSISGVAGDNSNTQFAMMALWVARRHGVPVDEALTQVEARFRRVQVADGGWTYVVSGFQLEPSTPAMTCAGLLGIALGHGVKKSPQKKDILSDAAVKKGLQTLDRMLGEFAQKKEARDNDFYTLWSLERMAVVYDLKRIGDRDWYRFGSDLLVNSQNIEGSWTGKYRVADTCFALLFLKKANVAEDLTLDLLKGVIKDKPPEKNPRKEDKKKDGDKKDPGLKLPAVPPPTPKKPPEKQPRFEASLPELTTYTPAFAALSRI